MKSRPLAGAPLRKRCPACRVFHTTYDRQYSYLGTRGFGLPGDLHTRRLKCPRRHLSHNWKGDSLGARRLRHWSARCARRLSIESSACTTSRSLMLKATGLSPSLLELELTEGVVMQDTAATQQTLQAFQALGVQVALDDFGTGCSSLSYLKRMPLSCLKVDQSFVAGLPSDAQDRAIINAILAVAVGLGLRVIAGGIETQEQSQFLKQMGCHALQGYYFSRPVPTAEINVLLATSQTQAPSGLMAL